MRIVTVSMVLRTVLAVCIVCVATESRAESTLKGTLHYWQLDGNTEYNEGENYGNVSAKDSMNGIEMALEVACGLLKNWWRGEDQVRAIQQFTEGTLNEGHKKYNDGTPEAQNFVVMAVMLAGMATALHDGSQNPVQKYCNECLATGAACLANEEGKAPWWRIPNPGGRRSVKSTILSKTASCTSKDSISMSI